MAASARAVSARDRTAPTTRGALRLLPLAAGGLPCSHLKFLLGRKPRNIAPQQRAPWGGELEIVGGRALERRAPRSRVVVVSSRSGGALLGHEPASGRPAWAGRAPATNEELSVNQGWGERVRALLSPAAQGELVRSIP